MSTETFLLIGVFAGLLLVVEGASLYRNGGRLSVLVMTLSTVELGWFVLCIYALFGIDLPGWILFIPIAYLVYFAIVALQYARVNGLEDVERLSDITLSMNVAALEIGCGVALILLCALGWLQLPVTS